MKNFIQFIKESITDEKHKTLDKKIFTTEMSDWPVLIHSVKSQIMQGVYEFNQIAPVNNVYMVGSLLTKRYSSDSDIDINLEFDADTTDDITKDKLFGLMKSLNGRLAGQTSHPINFHLEFTDDLNSLDNIKDRFDNIYNLKNDKWIKQSKDTPANIQTYFDDFIKEVSKIDLATMTIRRNLIDIKKLKEFTVDEVHDLKQKIQSKLFEIERSIETMITTKKELSLLRKLAFQKPITPEELEKIKSKNNLPENIIYKLMERYYYWDLIEKLHEIIGDDGQIETKDINAITKAINDFAEHTKSVKQPVEESLSFFEYAKIQEGYIGRYSTRNKANHSPIVLNNDDIENPDIFKNTDEDKKYYEAYTNRHINKVKEIAQKLLMSGKITPNTEQIISNHDKSKLEEPEYSPYVKRKWMSKNRSVRGRWKKDPEIRSALRHHLKNNKHHPEYWYSEKTKSDGISMPEEYLWELLCDWGATSLEHNNTTREYFEKTKNKKFRWSKESEEFLDKHVDEIDEIIKNQKLTPLASDGTEIIELSDDIRNESLSFNEYTELQNLTETKKLKTPKSFRTPKIQTPGKSHQSRERKKESTSFKKNRQRVLKAYTKFLDKWREDRNEKFPVDEYIPSQFNAIKELKLAKKSKYGQWYLNPMQARWVSVHYHFETPTPENPIKQLSNMPIVLWCSPTGKYFLFKDPRLRNRSKRDKKPLKRLRIPSTRKYTKNEYNTRKYLPMPDID